MPPPVSRRDFRRQQQFENDLAQQASDRQQQSGMLNMLQSLYGIGQEQQLAPDKIAALRADTAGREAATTAQQTTNQHLDQELQQKHLMGEFQRLYGMPAELDAMKAKTAAIPTETAAIKSRTAAQDFENQWAQPRAEQDYAAGQAKIDATTALSGQHERPPAQSIPYLVQMGVMSPEEAQQFVLTPEMLAARKTAAATKEQKRQAAIAADKALQQPTNRGESNAAWLGRQAMDATKAAFPYYKALNWLNATH